MPRPALTKMGRGEQSLDSIHDSRPAITLSNLHKRRRLLRRRWQAGQHKRQAANECVRFGVAHRRKTLSLPLGLNEFVDVGLRPIALHTRRRRKTNRLKTPPLLSLLANGLPRDGFGNVLPAGLHDSRVGSPHRNPPLEILDDGRRQSRAVLGHLEILLLVSNDPKQPTRARLAGDEHRAAVAALGQTALPIQRQAALGLVAAVVALVTMLGEDRSDVFFEKLDLLRRGISHQADCRKTKRQ